MTDMLVIGKRINRRCAILGHSLRELAEKTDLSASFLGQLERGVTNASLASCKEIQTRSTFL